MKRKYKDYFDYYVELENDFFSTESYVTIEEDNFKTFSIKYAKLYLSICSEIDCLLKEICKNLNPNSTASKINQYYPEINSAFENFKLESVFFKKAKIELVPWKEWDESLSPKWWTYYNKVKHQRLEKEDETNIPYYKYANLENVFNALAALYIVEQYYMYSYSYLEEAKEESGLEDDVVKLQGIGDWIKSGVMFEFTSQRCYMKRWIDNEIYTSTFIESEVELKALDSLIHKQD